MTEPTKHPYGEYTDFIEKKVYIRRNKNNKPDIQGFCSGIDDFGIYLDSSIQEQTKTGWSDYEDEVDKVLVPWHTIHTVGMFNDID